jgi:hypothetical protein
LENIKENITSAKKSLGLHELEQHKPCFDDECVGTLIGESMALRSVTSLELM